MKESQYIIDSIEEEESFSLIDEISKYLKYWSWFLAAAAIGLLFGFLYTQYTPATYKSTAKIKIIQNPGETDIASESISSAWWLAGINLDNEIEVFKSYRLLSQVVSELRLDIAYYDVGTFKTMELWNPPFVVRKYESEDEIRKAQYFDIAISADGITVKDESGNTYVSKPNTREFSEVDLPFSIQIPDNVKLDDIAERDYRVAFHPIKATVMQLMNSLYVEPTNKKSDILTLALVGRSIDRSEVILNMVIDKFNQDGILDRQLISKRTLDFIDQRFIYLGGELDSIEVGKQNFKKSGNLSYIEEDATSLIQKKSIAEAEVFDLETQISLSRLLKNSVAQEAQYNLVPSDIGLENSSINTMVLSYNQLALQRGKLSSTVGASHPSLQQINEQLDQGKKNILRTIDIYQRQLNLALSQQKEEKNLAGEMFSRLPEKEKMLRSIERQQSIKENLFILLLQKREEAAINFAVTAPTIKIVDYAVSDNKPVFPRRKIIYPFSIILGMAIPFVVLFVRFGLDNKIYDQNEIQKASPTIPVLAEIPYIEGNLGIAMADETSVVAESFRILSTNINFQLDTKKKENGCVVFVTSSIKGEGKSSIAYGLSLAYASLNKKVLLVSADLRNPEIDNFFEKQKNALGLSDYLLHPEMVDLKACVQNGVEQYSLHKVCLSGTLQKNPAALFANSGFEKFIGQAKKEFDYVIIDTAPTLLVSDTMIISQYADLTLFIIRSGFTNKSLLDFANELKTKGKLHNMVYTLNAFERGSRYGYNYGYSDTWEATKPNWYHKFINQLTIWWRNNPLKSFIQNFGKNRKI